jgi:beta-phosphoglucomutase-like phosphatase (HAD superfamily)
MPKPVEHIFLDDGGVLNDNAQRGQQWPGLVGEYFAPLLGGSASRWAAANRAVIRDVMERWERRGREWEGKQTPRELYDAHQLDWISSMAAEVGAELPADDTARIAMADAATDNIQRRVRADYPGAVEAVMEMSLDYPLYTASGGCSWELERVHESVGLTGVFKTLYGADLVEHPKSGPGYYERIFAHAGVDPSTALVLDDKLACLSWAREAGARTILVSGARMKYEGVEATISSLAELPGLIIAKGL